MTYRTHNLVFSIGELVKVASDAGFVARQLYFPRPAFSLMTCVARKFLMVRDFMREGSECLGGDPLRYQTGCLSRSDRNWRLRRLLNAARRESGKSAENE